jgi:hypothetical protein
MASPRILERKFDDIVKDIREKSVDTKEIWEDTQLNSVITKLDDTVEYIRKLQKMDFRNNQLIQDVIDKFNNDLGNIGQEIDINYALPRRLLKTINKRASATSATSAG